MSTIDWSCPWCGRHLGIEEREFRTAASITCPECHTSVDLAPDSAPSGRQGGPREAAD